MTTRQFAKLLPLDYQKLKQGRGKSTWFVRQSKQSCIMAVVEKNTTKTFLPEMHFRDDVFWLARFENDNTCFVDFRDVAIGSTLCRYHLTKENNEAVHYTLIMDVFHEGQAFRLFASGDELGEASLRRTQPEKCYKEVVLKAFGSKNSTTSFNLMDRGPRKGCCYTIGEDPFYDEFFPEHPLTQLRALAKAILKSIAKEAT